MIECLLFSSRLPAPNTTLVVDRDRCDVGGSAFNISWYLHRLGRKVTLVAPYGKRHAPVVKETFARAHVDTSGLIPVHGDCDVLVTLWSHDRHRSIYIRAPLPRRIAAVFSNRCRYARPVIISGSRHAPLRKLITDLVASQRIEVLGFNPSYAVYEYRPTELAYLMTRARVTILNEQECKYVCALRNLRRDEQLAELVGDVLIVTGGRKGAKVYSPSSVIYARSLAQRAVLSLGAGDAFLAGFLHMTLRGADATEATLFASAMAGIVVESPNVRAPISERQIRKRVATVRKFRRAVLEVSPRASRSSNQRTRR